MFAPKVKAQIQGDALVVSLPTAEVPSVQRIALGDARHWVVEVRLADGQWVLGSTSDGGQFKRLAEFTERKDALAALHAITERLNAGTKEVPAVSNWRIFFISMITMLVVVIFIQLVDITLRSLNSASPNAAPATSMPPPAAAAPSFGVPSAADQLVPPR